MKTHAERKKTLPNREMLTVGFDRGSCCQVWKALPIMRFFCYASKTTMITAEMNIHIFCNPPPLINVIISFDKCVWLMLLLLQRIPTAFVSNSWEKVRSHRWKFDCKKIYSILIHTSHLMPRRKNLFVQNQKLMPHFFQSAKHCAFLQESCSQKCAQIVHF